MLMKIGVGLAVLIVGFVVVVATRPDRFHIERSATIAAPPDVVFAQLDDFHKWSAWSPWEALDPTMKKTFDGPASGAGAVYSWVGNDKVGEGRMTIVAASAPSQVDIKL